VYTSAGLAYYRHADWLGSSRFASTPVTRTKYFDAAYAPYGEDYADSGTSDLDFTGQNQDTVSGLYDFLFREYHPVSGRWIQPDPAGIGAVSMTNPQSWNRYAYVVNAPLNFVDFLGLGPCVPGAPNYENDCAPPPKGGDEPAGPPNVPSGWLAFEGLHLHPPACDDSGCGKIQKSPPANKGKPPCSQNKTYPIPNKLQAAMLANGRTAYSSVTLTANGDLAGFEFVTLKPYSLGSLQIPADSRVSIGVAPGGFTLDVSGGPGSSGYMSLPTESWYSAAVNFVQFSSGAFANVNGQITVGGINIPGTWLGLNSDIQAGLNGNPQALQGANRLASALANCSY